MCGHLPARCKVLRVGLFPGHELGAGVGVEVVGKMDVHPYVEEHRSSVLDRVEDEVVAIVAAPSGWA